MEENFSRESKGWPVLSFTDKNVTTPNQHWKTLNS